jgi:hypothetical protein
MNKTNTTPSPITLCIRIDAPFFTPVPIRFQVLNTDLIIKSWLLNPGVRAEVNNGISRQGKSSNDLQSDSDALLCLD